MGRWFEKAHTVLHFLASVFMLLCIRARLCFATATGGLDHMGCATGKVVASTVWKGKREIISETHPILSRVVRKTTKSFT